MPRVVHFKHAWLGLVLALPCFGCGGAGDLCQSAADHVAECLGVAPEPVTTCTEAMADAASALLAQPCDELASTRSLASSGSCSGWASWLGLCKLHSSGHGTRTIAFDFSRGAGDLGFKGLFRDVPAPQHAEYLRRVAGGLDLGPVPPKTITLVNAGSPLEASHWFMNAGVHEVPDNPGVFGYLLQGVNRSDDMDKYMVRQLGPADGLRPRTRYDIVIDELTYAANDRIGAFGPGGGEARLFEAYVVNRDPYPFVVDFNKLVRFREDNRPSMKPGLYSSLGGTGVCVLSGSGIPLPGVKPCPKTGRVPYAILKSMNVRPLSITTNDQGRFWLMIGGHSGHESLDEYFVIRLRLTIEGDFVESSP
jgi:hypothetical protein